MGFSDLGHSQNSVMGFSELDHVILRIRSWDSQNKVMGFSDLGQGILRFRL